MLQDEHYIGFFFHSGPWMDTFGLGDAAKHIGTPQSIAIRNPDCSVATHLMHLVEDNKKAPLDISYK